MSSFKQGNKLRVFGDVFLHLQKPFEQLDLEKLIVDYTWGLTSTKNTGKLFIAYSYDNQNFSRFVDYENRKVGVIDDQLKLYVCLLFKTNGNEDLEIPTSLHDGIIDTRKFVTSATKQQNVKQHSSGDFLGQNPSGVPNIIINSISYDNQSIDLSEIKLTQKYKLVDEYPRWNFYDAQQINIQRWLETNNAIAESYGHTVIYFKTEPVETTEENPQTGIHGTHYSLANNVIRNVVDVKRLHVLIPQNELPQDRAIFTEWDIAMQDDFMIHIVRQKFELAFGLKAVPNEKDFIYFPLLNKLYRVQTMQPKNGFMGVIGWYETFLGKWENDEHVKHDVSINQILKNSLVQSFPNMDMFGFIETEENYEEIEDLIDDVEDLIDDGSTFIDEEKRIEEEKIVTENHTNALRDTTHYISLKETEKLREFYNKRLEIVSVNPGNNLFPVTMYNCTPIDKRSVALTYTLKDYSINNRYVNRVEINYQLSFNFVLMGRFCGEVIDLISEVYQNVICSISIDGNKFKIFDTRRQVEIIFEQRLQLKEFYQVIIEYIQETDIYMFKLFQLKNYKGQENQRILIDQNIFKLKDFERIDVKYDQKPIIIERLNLFGGQFLINDIVLKIDNQKFIEDNCLPLMVHKMN